MTSDGLSNASIRAALQRTPLKPVREVRDGAKLVTLEPAAQDAEAVLGPLSSALWELRELLDMVCYVLTVQRLLATAGEAKYLSFAAQQLDVVTGQLRRTEIVRASATERAAGLLGVGATASLADIAAAAPCPWDEILNEHRDALRTAADQVTALRNGTEEALRSGADAVKNSLRAMEESVRGRSAGERTAAGRLDYRA